MPTDSPEGPTTDVVVVTLPREVDLESAPGVRDELMAALSRAPHLVVDATGVTFMDSSGVNALVRARERAHRLGGSVHVVATGRAVLRVLALTRLSRALGVVGHADEALRCVRSPAGAHTCGRPDGGDV